MSATLSTVTQAALGQQELPAVSVIVPCYNEERAAAQTLEQLECALATVGRYELIFVDDGSTDGTAARLQEARAGRSSVRVIRHARNRGYGAALKTGLRAARSELVAITDADGTYPNDRLPDLIRAAAASDMVVGARTGKNVSYPFIRRVPKAFLRAYASWIAGQPIPDINSGLRVFRRELALKFLGILPDGFSFTTTITVAMLTNSYAVEYVPIDYAERIGRSKIRPIRDTLNFFHLIARTGIYFAPLRVFLPIATLLGLGFVASAIYDVFVLGNLTDKTVILLMFTMNTGMFAALADMIDKRTIR
jgi:glycosyltransferase involved in cell wall biosynthesis